jgi:hypothetical protein
MQFNSGAAGSRYSIIIIHCLVAGEGKEGLFIVAARDYRLNTLGEKSNEPNGGNHFIKSLVP